MLPELTSLPGNSVYALASTPRGQMLIGTDQGAALWTPANQEGADEEWQFFTPVNSALPNREVISVLASQTGDFWFGTRQGLARLSNQEWQTYYSNDWGLDGDTVYEIMEGKDGKIWIGTDGGAAVFDGEEWIAYNQDNSGLPDNLVLSIAISPEGDRERVYFGSGKGLSQLDIASGIWESILPDRFRPESGGTSDLMFDSQGRLWVATLGSGVHIWDGNNWKQYLTVNSEIPTNRVDRVSEIGDGVYWLAVSFPERPGGKLARFDGSKWLIYEPIYTGYSGSSTVSIAPDALGRIWFGTLTAGVDIYSP
jgi:ligand-binding sensor domain-containing protein